MITATFKKEYDLIVAFTVSGHACSAPKGQDIICAAVSALVIATSNALAQFNKCDVVEDNGLVECVVREPEELTNVLIQPLLIGIQGISDKYPNNVKVVIDDGI